MAAAPLSSRVPTSNESGLFALSLIDPLLLLLTTAVVWRTFGVQPALLMVILLGTHMTMSHSHLKGALLRTDWVASLVLAVCALKAKRPALSGALLAYSAMLRVFPLLFAAGLLAGRDALLVGDGHGAERRGRIGNAAGLR